MKTDPTPQVTGAAGTPLSHAAIEHGRNFSQRSVARSKPADTIADTLETSDREADGRQPLVDSRSRPPVASVPKPSQETTGDNLDMTA